MINDAVRGYFGFERLPFDRSIPVGALFASSSHQEAVGASPTASTPARSR